MKYFLILFFLVLFFTTGCGYKVIDRSKFGNFGIAEMNTSGETRINYKIKNKLFFNTDKNNNNLIILDLESKKTKKIEEKNDKNEITKYRLFISVDVSFKKITDTEISSFIVKKTGIYNVGNRYSQTLSNEKKLTEILTNDVVDEIFDELSIKLNDI
tara:strand:- start:471 stop:941 length:471 start_codon:yes stop_codon:yes gene_type:complete